MTRPTYSSPPSVASAKSFSLTMSRSSVRSVWTITCPRSGCVGPPKVSRATRSVGVGWAVASSPTTDQIFWRAESIRPSMLPLVSRQMARSMVGGASQSGHGSAAASSAPTADSGSARQSRRRRKGDRRRARGRGRGRGGGSASAWTSRGEEASDSGWEGFMASRCGGGREGRCLIGRDRGRAGSPRSCKGLASSAAGRGWGCWARYFRDALRSDDPDPAATACRGPRPAGLRDARQRRHGSTRRRDDADVDRARCARLGPDGARHRPARALRSTDPPAERTRPQARGHLPEHAWHDRQRLSRRDPGDPHQPRRRRFRDQARPSASRRW